MSAFHDNALMGASGSQGYQISRSVRLRSSASAYFSRTPATAGNRKTWTWSGWVKRGALGTVQIFTSCHSATTDASNMDIGFYADDTLRVVAWTTTYRTTTQVFRDPSAWYHLMIVIDTTQATANDRVKLYVNGTQVTVFTTTNNPTQNSDIGYNQAATTRIGSSSNAVANLFDGYLTEVNFIDGQALTPTSFGQFNSVTGVWRPLKYTGTYGTNGFYLNFSDNSNNTATTIGKDYSGNGNNWTPNNISVTSGSTYDSMLDVPTPYADGGNGRGNYCTLNPLKVYSSLFLSNANLRFQNTNAYWANTRCTIQPEIGGKYYFEFTSTQSYTVNNVNYIGLCTPSMSLSASSGDIANIYNNTTSGEVLALAIDRVNNQVSYYRNNSLVSTASISATAEMDVVVGAYASSGDINFGQRPFAYTPPTGFKALNTFNLPDSTIVDGSKYFDVALYTGDNNTTQSVNVGLVPDFVWIKSRTSGTGHHSLIDRVRGDVALNSNQTIAEYGVTAFNMNTDGTIDVPYYASDYSMNTSANSYVAWNWKESASAGFDIVTYTGTGANRTVAHSLGVAPSMLIFKPRNAADNWPVWHKSFAVNEYVYLNLTNAKASLSTFMNSTLPDSSNITLGTWANTNANTQTMVCYAFSEVAGFSKFGSYTGNGSADGPFVYLGFRPRFVMFKRTDTTSNWTIFDSSRDPSNVSGAVLYPNLSDAEGSLSNMDILSNGFKFRATGSNYNASGATYIFAAFAENPFKNSLAR